MNPYTDLKKTQIEIIESKPDKPSLRSVQTKSYGIPKNAQYKAIQDFSRAHVQSFNYMLEEGLNHMIQDIPPLEIGLANGDQVKVHFRRCWIDPPAIKRGTVAKTNKVYPSECRGRHVSYRGGFQVSLSWTLNGVVQEIIEKPVGEVPIMVKSRACNLNNLTPSQLVAVGEEESEFGGYFVINGLEKIVRLLIMQRRNYPIAMQRNGWKRRGDMFTEYGVSIRCVRKDQSGTMIVLHYLSDGTVKLMFSYKRILYFVPLMLILKALVNDSDNDIYNQLIKGKEEDTFYRGCIAKMLRQMSCAEGIVFQEQALNFLGEKFSVKFGLPSWYSSIDVAKYLLEQCICIHLGKPREKFDLLVFMVKKLFAVVKNECALESPDNPMNQEVLLPGHLYLLVLKEKLYAWQLSLRLTLERKMKAAKTMTITQTIFRDCLAKTTDVTRAVENVFSTGNFLPRYENGLTQFSGLAIVGDKLNFWRYLSHFRAVHRGAFFAEMRTTTVRKLLPEAWGFLCPVHTPDGSPCGLLNHMCSTAQIVNVQPDTSHLYNLFIKYGMLTYGDPSAQGYIVIFDGKVIGWVYEKKAFSFVKTIRNLKSLGLENVPKTLEICLVPQTEHASQYPGIFIFTTPARMIRPVLNLESGVTELIGSMEQVYLHVALDSSGIVDGVTLHQELDKHGFLSVLANQIPYSDFNQSPRNMYECQMGKQTMGTPCHALRYRSDNKLYQILIPQAPIVRPTMHDYYHMDDYPMGTNAVVAVISYSGFDMEDAIVLNKSSVERGFKHGCIFKTEIINLRVIAGDRGLQKTLVFGRKKEEKNKYPFIDEDGLPYVGTRLNRGDPICCYIDASSGNSVVVKYKSMEMAYIHDVRLLGNDTGTETNQQISVTYRIPRNPIIGDKFASRHGQKGICSIMLPREDMPFTEGGMTPDILFNPHGFPSRMTIGMMIESMAGKAAAMKGTLYDASPFTFSESESAVNYFGECLKEAGFDYYGTERMYSGVSGEELEADIFFGVVYYQRLRHMVADKYQVRTTGPVDSLTRQPVKGRKREGGVRFGEMERDSLIAHGTDLLIHDRLFNCSDGCQQYVCSKCKNLLSPLAEKRNPLWNNMEVFPNEWKCKVCNSGEYITAIDIPYVFRYLCAELAAVNFKVTLNIGNYQ